MKKQLIFLLLGMILVVIGALLKINHVGFGQYVLLAGLAVEAYILGYLVLQSLRK
jgi:hypothetical protein